MEGGGGRVAVRLGRCCFKVAQLRGEGEESRTVNDGG